MTAIKMSLRTFATLTLLIGLIMWIFNLALPTLLYIHIACAIIVLVLAVVVLFLPAPATGNIRLFQGIVVLLTVCTMVVGLLQYRQIFVGLAATLTHLILALAVVSLIEMTIARQNRIARAARTA
jgi:hypothetical protein